MLGTTGVGAFAFVWTAAGIGGDSVVSSTGEGGGGDEPRILRLASAYAASLSSNVLRGFLVAALMGERVYNLYHKNNSSANKSSNTCLLVPSPVVLALGWRLRILMGWLEFEDMFFFYFLGVWIEITDNLNQIHNRWFPFIKMTPTELKVKL